LKFKEESEKKNKEIRYLKQEVEFLKDRLLTEDLRSSKKIRKLERNLHVKDRTIKNLNSEIYNTNISRIEERSISKESNTSRRHMIRDIVDQDNILTGSMQLNIKKITEFNGQLDSVLDQCKTTLDNSTNHAQAISKESIREIS